MTLYTEIWTLKKKKEKYSLKPFLSFCIKLLSETNCIIPNAQLWYMIKEKKSFVKILFTSWGIYMHTFQTGFCFIQFVHIS